MNFAFLTNVLPSLRSLLRRREPRHRLGTRGERLAARYLRGRNYRVLARNLESPAGEIDLVCSNGPAIVFIEVKTRTTFDAQNPGEAAKPVQWRRIERAAKIFLRQYVNSQRPVRFDLVTVEWPTTGAPRIEHHEGAHHPSFV